MALSALEVIPVVWKFTWDHPRSRRYSRMPRTPDVRDTHLELVFDATVLSNFSVVGQCALLDLYYRGRAYTTLMVVEELQRGLEAGYEYLRLP
jgi:hypothetical protein